MRRMTLLLGCVFVMGLFSCKTAEEEVPMNDEDVCILVNGSDAMTSLEVGQEYILRLSNSSSATWAIDNATAASLSASSGVSVKLSTQLPGSVAIMATMNRKTYTCALQITEKDGDPNVSFTNLSEYKVVVCRDGLSTEITTVEADGTKSVYVSPGTNEITFYFRYSYCIIDDNDNGTIWMDVTDNSAYTYTIDSADIAQDTVRINILAPKNPKFDVAYLKVENKSMQPISLYKTLYKPLFNETSSQKLYNKAECYIDTGHSGVYRIPTDALFEGFTLGASYPFSATAVAPFYAESGVLYTCEFSEAASTINVREEIRLSEAGAGSVENTYIVHHFLQDTDGKNYTLKDTELLTGTTGETTIANAKNYIGFTAKRYAYETTYMDGTLSGEAGWYETFTQATISADGSTVVNIYYDRNAYTVTFNSNNGTGYTATQVFYYGVPQKLNRNTFPYSSYIFIGWGWSETDDIAYANQAEFCGEYTSNVTLYAKWSIATADTVENIDLTGVTGEYTVKVIGDISQGTLYILADKMKYKKDILINLDLSEAVLERIDVKPTSAQGIFCDCPLYSIALPKTLKTIGCWAFAWYDNLKSITIPASVQTIEHYAFSHCSNLEAVEIDGAEIVGNCAFKYCESLKNVVLKNTKIIDSHAFSDCSNLEAVEIDGAENVCNYAFGDGCDSLKSIVLKNTKIIDSHAFSDCYNLETVEIDGAGTIYKGAFCACNITLKNVNTIDENTFCGCTNLLSVIMESIGSIGSSAFARCTNLSSVTMKSIGSIGSSAFARCINLSSVTMKSIDSIGSYAFERCTNLSSVTMKSIGSIGSSAFGRCTNLSSVTMKSIDSIGSYAFEDCTSLSTITIDAESIDSRAFSDCTSLTAVVIGKNVKSINNTGYGCFYNCLQLTSVRFEDTEGWMIDVTNAAENTSNLQGYSYDYLWYKE